MEWELPRDNGVVYKMCVGRIQKKTIVIGLVKMPLEKAKAVNLKIEPFSLGQKISGI